MARKSLKNANQIILIHFLEYFNGFNVLRINTEILRGFWLTSAASAGAIRPPGLLVPHTVRAPWSLRTFVQASLLLGELSLSLPIYFVLNLNLVINLD